MILFISDGKAFGKGNKSEDLPLHDYSTLSGKKRRVKPVLFYSSFLFPDVLDLKKQLFSNMLIMNLQSISISMNAGGKSLFAIAVFIAVLIRGNSDAQILDSVHELRSFTVSADRLNIYTQGMKITSIDSLTLGNYRSDDAAVLLASQTPVYVKTYGQGGLSTLSVRGTLATHAGVYWNGININQPNLGQTDISLVPLFFFESVALQLGGSSALFGSGNIGGGLHLENSPKFSSPLKLRVTSGIGSFHERFGNFKASFSGKGLAYSVGASLKSQENDFPYTDVYHNYVKQKHAAVRNMNVLQQIDIKTGSSSILSAGMWFLKSDRDLPSSMIASQSNEHQYDQSLRTYIKWELVNRLDILIIRSAWLAEKMHYTNPKILIDALYLTHTGLLEGEYRYQISQGTLFGISGKTSQDQANITNYSGVRNQIKGSIVGSFRQVLPIPGWSGTLSLRKEWIKGYSVPYCPSFGAEGRINKYFSAKLHIASNFRAPTLNERFWQPGGNEHLNPEKSISSEAGINWQTFNSTKKWQAGIGITGYYCLIKDLILWVPLQGNINISSPENIQEVLSRGVEINSDFSINLRKLKGKFHLAYSYTPSTFNKNEAGKEPIKGKQLVYVPLHNAVAGLRIDYSNFFLDWEQSLTGKRFILNDNSKYLDEYTLGSLTFGNIFSLSKIKLGLQAEIRNLFNMNYQTIQNYAVPGRSFRIIINIIH
jgi:vitamin B12 transporter